MVDCQKATSTAAPSAPPARTSAGYGAIARRVAGWTGNLLASAIVIVATLAIGRQIMEWWRDPPAPAAAAKLELPSALPDELKLWTPHGSLTLEQARGDRDAALAALRRRCAQEANGSPPAAALRPGEEQFLARLANSAPIEQTGGIDLYQPQGELTMVVAVTRKPRRIAAWSFAVSVEESIWSCYTVRPGDVPPGAALGGSP